jgi:hypothetical protein
MRIGNRILAPDPAENEGPFADLLSGFTPSDPARAIALDLLRHAANRSLAQNSMAAPESRPESGMTAMADARNGARSAARNDGGDNAGYATLEEARLAGYRKLPYGKGVRNEWSAIVYIKDGRFHVSEPSEGRKNSTLFKIKFDDVSGVSTTFPGDHGISGSYPIAELLHTHPTGDGNPENFSGGRNGDIDIAEKHKVPISIRYRDSIRLYDPAREFEHYSSHKEILNHPGKILCDPCF